MFGHLGLFWRTVDSLSAAILAIFAGQHIYRLRPFGPCPKSRSVDDFSPFRPFSEGGRFIIFDHFGLFQRAVDSLFSATLAFSGGRYVHYFWPFGLCSWCGRFIICGRIERGQSGVDLLPSVDLANFAGW